MEQKLNDDDADIGAGGATEDTSGRDRDRNGYNTTATYTLLDPSGHPFCLTQAANWG